MVKRNDVGKLALCILCMSRVVEHDEVLVINSDVMLYRTPDYESPVTAFSCGTRTVRFEP